MCGCILGWQSVAYHFRVTVTMTSDLVFIVIKCPSVPLRVRCISPIFFEVGIPNLVCGCILGWQSVAYHFRVTVTLTSDLVFIVIKCPSVPLHVRRISPIFFEVGIPSLVCRCILGWRSVAYHFWVTVNLTSDLVFRIIMSGAYL